MDADLACSNLGWDGVPTGDDGPGLERVDQSSVDVAQDIGRATPPAGEAEENG